MLVSNGRQQSFILDPHQLVMRNDPLLRPTPPAPALFSTNTAEPTPLPHRERRLLHHRADFIGRVPLLDGPLCDQDFERCLNPGQALCELFDDDRWPTLRAINHVMFLTRHTAVPNSCEHHRPKCGRQLD